MSNPMMILLLLGEDPRGKRGNVSKNKFLNKDTFKILKKKKYKFEM